MYPFCHHTQFEGKKYLIPMCWPVVHSGDRSDCTCPHPGIKNAEIRKRRMEIEKLEAEIEEIKARVIP